MNELVNFEKEISEGKIKRIYRFMRILVGSLICYIRIFYICVSLVLKAQVIAKWTLSI